MKFIGSMKFPTGTELLAPDEDPENLNDKLQV
jgi:hypothetical protein